MILCINAGSSSIKFALFKQRSNPEKLASGEIKRIGLKGTRFTSQMPGAKQRDIPVHRKDYAGAMEALLEELDRHIDFSKVKGIGHRIVHGMRYTEPVQIDKALIKMLKQIVPFDPDHLPYEIRLVELFAAKYPDIPQFACFDTAFHRNMPETAKRLPIPARFDRAGVRRYGFHGLSYSYLLQALERDPGRKKAGGKIVLAHLGNGASLAAVSGRTGKDTSMGFSPVGGIPMSTRTGDLDPGAAWYMIKSEKLSPKQFDHLVNAESGLLGISGSSGDMKDLLARRAKDAKAALAVDLFCYQVKKWIGAFAAALGGLDILVFSGGIGEFAPEVRSAICHGMGFMGISLDPSKNRRNARLISKSNAPVAVYVIHTEEEWMIARIVNRLLRTSNKSIRNKKH
ncbi:MAG TPA: acetate/propionate family kinase [Puia sp.]|nr:acetate/propionate family kinase [Puia sp.]